MNNTNTAHEVLIAELLGDVGNLHDQIKDLPEVLNQALEPTQKQLGESQRLLSEQLAKLPGAADKELNRASNVAIGRLSEEVGRIAQRIAGDTAAEARQKSFYLAAAVLTVFSIVFFGSGMAIGTHNFGLLVVSSLCLGIGVIAGMVLCQYMIASDIGKRGDAGMETKATTVARLDRSVTSSIGPWTESEFQRVVETMRTRPDARMQAACRDVIFNGISPSDAEKKQKLFPNSVERVLEKMNRINTKNSAN